LWYCITAAITVTVAGTTITSSQATLVLVPSMHAINKSQGHCDNCSLFSEKYPRVTIELVKHVYLPLIKEIWERPYRAKSCFDKIQQKLKLFK
jgi:hypothetical protein